jgi:hypothetical protein
VGGAERLSVVGGPHGLVAGLVPLLLVDHAGHPAERNLDCSAVTTPWCSQLATCREEMRQVAWSSMSAVPWISGTFEQPTPSSIQRFT